jgi:hypothetical protein
LIRDEIVDGGAPFGPRQQGTMRDVPNAGIPRVPSGVMSELRGSSRRRQATTRLQVAIRPMDATAVQGSKL